MVRIDGGFSVRFREQIKEFCSENDLQIDYLNNLGYYDRYNISGEVKKIQELQEFVDKLEQERKQKSFWYKLWN